MFKAREIADTPLKGRARYHLYKDVIDRYLESLKDGYYLEAITLMESLITDRLEAALIHHGLMNQTHAFRTLEYCLRTIKPRKIITQKLYEDLMIWKKARNHALHEMAKIEAGTTPVFSNNYSSLQVIAIDGYNLFKRIKKELK